jgi:6-pyruvoyltetrahydropterin/6-carboxytetrahydropterin synthase
MRGRFEIVKEFSFEAAHRFGQSKDGGIVHGHSFRVAVALSGEPDSATGCVADFDVIGKALRDLHDALDHHLLDELPGLAQPSLENIARWIAERLKPQFAQLSSVTVMRPTCGESCRYEPAGN